MPTGWRRSKTLVISGLRYNFDADHDAEAWQASGPWKNELPFNNAWRPEQVSIDNGRMRLMLEREVCDREDCLGKPYASGEYKTLQRFQYGRIEARMKPARGAGVVSSLFTYSDPFGNAELTSPDGHDEIDIEFLGQDTTQVQFNYWKGGLGGHEFCLDLGFDAADSFNIYAFEWRRDRIDWFVNNRRVYGVQGRNLPTIQGHIFANLWPVAPGVTLAGDFVYSQPITAEYDWIAYTPLENVDANALGLSSTGWLRRRLRRWRRQ